MFSCFFIPFLYSPFKLFFFASILYSISLYFGHSSSLSFSFSLPRFLQVLCYLFFLFFFSLSLSYVSQTIQHFLSLSLSFFSFSLFLFLFKKSKQIFSFIFAGRQIVAENFFVFLPFVLWNSGKLFFFFLSFRKREKKKGRKREGGTVLRNVLCWVLSWFVRAKHCFVAFLCCVLYLNCILFFLCLSLFSDLSFISFLYFFLILFTSICMRIQSNPVALLPSIGLDWFGFWCFLHWKIAIQRPTTLKNQCSIVRIHFIPFMFQIYFIFLCLFLNEPKICPTIFCFAWPKFVFYQEALSSRQAAIIKGRKLWLFFFFYSHSFDSSFPLLLFHNFNFF